MDPASSQQLIFLFILLFLSGFFSMSETALTSLSKIRLRNMVDENEKNARLIQKIVSDPKKLLTAILIGNNIVNISASALATSIAIGICTRLNIPAAKGISAATGALTFLVLIFGEISPKTYAAQNSEKVCVLVCKPIAACMFILTPVVIVLNILTTFIIKIMGADPSKAMPTITESELLTMVNVSHEEGVLETDEREMINNVVDFGNSNADDVMVPRTDIIAVQLDASYDEVAGIFKKEKLSRLPVYGENMDNIVGIISYKDIFCIEDRENFHISKYMREPFFTYESKPSKELFALMRTKSISMAIVLDEYGGTSGLVALEDLLEEIVGEISDEYDDDNEEIEVIKEDEYIVEGSTKIEDVNEMIGTSFESEDFDSIGGYVIGIIGRFPEQGEMIETENAKFVIEAIDKNRIEKLRILT